MKKEPFWDEYQEDSTKLDGLPAHYIPPTNDRALLSFLAGLGGWALAVFSLCPFTVYLSLCCASLALLSWGVGLFSGFTARRQLAAREEGGSELATWGLLSSAAGILLAGLALLLVVSAALLSLTGLSLN